VVQRVVSLYTVRARAKGIELRHEVAASMPSQLMGDPTRLTQLLSNFVSNAIKFTDQGQVCIRIELVEEASEFARIRCSVTDSGIGIPDDVQRKLFAAFTQADGSTSRRFGGTGLGLAICKQIVGLLDREHGEIGVRSKVGEGATFYFALRLAKPAPGTQTLVTSTRNAVPKKFTGRVLVAEDNETNQQVAMTLLRSLGLEPTLAVDGRKAVECCERERFDLILMDYHMPELDGHAATLAIREHERANSLPRTPIVAVTASVLKEDKDRCEAAGMDDFLAKPIRQLSLAAMLAKWLPAAEEDSAPQTEFEPPNASHVRDCNSGIDRAQFNEMQQITGEGFAELLQQFHLSVRDGLEALRVALQMQDAQSLRRAAHKLKGTVATLGATDLAARCLELETMGHAGTLEGATEKIEQLAAAYLPVRARFEEWALRPVSAAS
jgi:CheY-like chemotaxis protein/HPt (histidine-containing phosphotransfer) domain-containing protein